KGLQGVNAFMVVTSFKKLGNHDDWHCNLRTRRSENWGEFSLASVHPLRAYFPGKSLVCGAFTATVDQCQVRTAAPVADNGSKNNSGSCKIRASGAFGRTERCKRGREDESAVHVVRKPGCHGRPRVVGSDGCSGTRLGGSATAAEAHPNTCH